MSEIVAVFGDVKIRVVGDRDSRAWHCRSARARTPRARGDAQGYAARRPARHAGIGQKFWIGCNWSGRRVKRCTARLSAPTSSRTPSTLRWSSESFDHLRRRHCGCGSSHLAAAPGLDAEPTNRSTFTQASTVVLSTRSAGWPPAMRNERSLRKPIAQTTRRRYCAQNSRPKTD